MDVNQLNSKNDPLLEIYQQHLYHLPFKSNNLATCLCFLIIESKLQMSKMKTHK